jgi:hypothetical protein
MNFQNFCNPFTIAAAPTRANENQFVPWLFSDTPDWMISETDTNALVCMNPGVWNIAVQYQIIGRRPTTDAFDSTVVGWLNVNGVDVPNSAATQYASRPNANNVLVVCIANRFNVGDEVRLGIRSLSVDGDLNVGVNSYETLAGVVAPSVIVTAVRTSS